MRVFIKSHRNQSIMNDTVLPNLQAMSKEEKLNWIKSKPRDIRFMGDVSEELYKAAIKKDNLCIMYLPKQTQKYINIALSVGHIDLNYVDITSLSKSSKKHLNIPSNWKNKQFTASDFSGRRTFGLGLCHDQTKEICELAITRDVLNLECVRDQTKHLCELAASINPLSLVLVRKQTFELILFAAKKYKEKPVEPRNSFIKFNFEDTINWNILTSDEQEYIRLL